MNKIVSTFLLLIIVSSISACNISAKNEGQLSKGLNEQNFEEENLKAAYFASGCFWCVEAVFQSVKGVKDAISGYSGGEVKNPTYKQVSSGALKHAEAVKVWYDPTQIDYATLVKVFFGSHDPTTVNRQGPDRGPQYRSIAFYETEDEKEIIENYIQKLELEGTYSKIVTEVKLFDVFWEAEEYHQEYENLHPENPYVQNVSIPRLKKFKANFPELLKAEH